MEASPRRSEGLPPWEHRRHLESLVKELDGPDADAKNKALNELIELAQKGDAEAETRLVERFENMVKEETNQYRYVDLPPGGYDEAGSSDDEEVAPHVCGFRKDRFALTPGRRAIQATDRKDFEQEARIGLLRAIRTYDPTKGPFSQPRGKPCWVRWRIKNELQGASRRIQGVMKGAPAPSCRSLRTPDAPPRSALVWVFVLSPPYRSLRRPDALADKYYPLPPMGHAPGATVPVSEVHYGSAESEFLSKHLDFYWKEEVKECVRSLPDYRRFVLRWGIWWAGPMKPEEQAEWEGVSKKAIGNSLFTASKRLSRHFKNENGRLIRRSA